VAWPDGSDRDRCDLRKTSTRMLHEGEIDIAAVTARYSASVRARVRPFTLQFDEGRYIAHRLLALHTVPVPSS